MNPQVRRAYTAAAATITEAYGNASGYADQEVTPPLLVEALEQCIEALGAPDAHALPRKERDELGTHALNCVSDLALWASLLKLEAERAAVEDLGLEFAGGLAAHGTRIAVLEPVVNALARRANATADADRLVPLAELARAVIGAAAEDARAAATGANPWHTLNFNYAIIATRTQRPALMAAAYDLLEANLPELCPAFFAEGVRESEKTVYGPHVGAAMRERLAKWTVPQ